MDWNFILYRDFKLASYMYIYHLIIIYITSIITKQYDQKWYANCPTYLFGTFLKWYGTSYDNSILQAMEKTYFTIIQKMNL
jgi:hypothetical protein